MNEHKLVQDQQGFPAPFASALFAHAAAEDVRRYAREEIKLLAASAWRHLNAPRTLGQSSIRLLDAAADEPNLRQITILEVVNDDMPYLLDSTLADLTDGGFEIRLVTHPIFAVSRDVSGRLLDFYPDGASAPIEARRESFIHIHLGKISSDSRRADLTRALERTYGEVRAAAADREAMSERIGELVDQLRTSPPPLPADDLAEAVQFLEWLTSGNFIFLGQRSYLFSTPQPDGARKLAAAPDSGLGILRDASVSVLRRGRELVDVTPEVLEFMRQDHLLIIVKANVKSRVHRHVQMDYVGVKQFDSEGALLGELRIVGLFASASYTKPVQNVPYVRHKIARVMERSHLDPESHSGRVLAETLETYPRDELFQIDAATLARFASEIAALQERPRLRILSRVDRFDRFVSILAYLPRDRYDTKVQARVGQELARIYQGRVSAVYPFYPEGPLVRIHYIIGRYEGATPQPSRDKVEAAVARVVRTWSDLLADALVERYGDGGYALALKWAAAFSAGYMEAFDAAEALEDIALAQRLSESNPHAVVLRRRSKKPHRIDLDVFSRGRPMPLSDRAPVLESMGFRVISERTFEMMESGGSTPIWLHDMALETASSETIDLDARGALIEVAVAAVFRGLAENDGYNALVLRAGLSWREVALIRTFSRYLRQAAVGWSQNYMWQTASRNSRAMDLLVALFAVRFDPSLALTETERAARETSLTSEIDALIRKVASLDEDRILRRFLNLVQAAVRTNFYQSARLNECAAPIAIKFESRKIDGLPLPRPMYEVTVYSPRVEGVHLRFGKVARGGIRWSDRLQDFRTEVLGLVKAQQVKNAVIVPVGAKGGFVPKQLPSPDRREEWLAEGVSAYKLFIGSLLEITDNLVGDSVVPPADVIRRDGDDPYLVVAADKGTATFSDTANQISQDRRFWLADAFASGGSAGYDHKKMGITARGAWEAVKRHFRERDIDIQTTPFTVAGVGDMSGDVFGNGMLLSRATKLVAAFDHRDIFLDPSPDPEIAFAERARLFELPRSSWQDYDREALSPGGGVYARSTKTIPLTPQARTLLGIAQAEATPAEVMSAILRADVDLLWFGGIGSYIRASDESDLDVGDRANDSIRIDAPALRCAVIGEGANLALTQRARIEAARSGVRLNTDAIDNSAGVNTSDFEVNIKIALSRPLLSGAIDQTGRDELLTEMTDDVAHLVLENNYRQTLAISLSERKGVDAVDFAIRLMQRLESENRLDRKVEFLLGDDELRERAAGGAGLTRPEIAVLLAYAKLALHDELLASDLPDEAYFRSRLIAYFPKRLGERFPEAIESHRLRREIIATQVANAVINFGGPSVIARVADETGANPASIARAFVVVQDAFSLDRIVSEIDALDGRLSGPAQLELYASVQELLLSRLQWFVRRVSFESGLGAIAEKFRAGVDELAANLTQVVSPGAADSIARRAQLLVEQGVPEALANKISQLGALSAACDVVLVAEEANRSMPEVAAAFFDADEAFGIGALLESAAKIPAPGFYERLALDRSLDGIEQSRRKLAAIIVRAARATERPSVSAWLDRRGPDAARIHKALEEIAVQGLTMSKTVVAASLLDELASTK